MSAMMSWDDFYECPKCGFTQCVPPTGDGKILLLGSIPHKDEISQGVPNAGGPGEILRAELAFQGLDMYACRMANLWLHPPKKPRNQTSACKTETSKQNAKCLAYSLKKALKQAKKCKAVLLMGATTVKYFTGKGVSDVNGLLVKSDMLSAPIVMASVQASTVFHGGVGEFRLAINNFADELEKENLL